MSVQCPEDVEASFYRWPLPETLFRAVCEKLKVVGEAQLAPQDTSTQSPPKAASPPESLRPEPLAEIRTSSVSFSNISVPEDAEKDSKNTDFVVESEPTAPIPGISNSLCRIVFDGGHKYCGPVQEGRLKGNLGMYEWNDGSKYMGTFSNSRMTGRGRILYADGSVYHGDLVNGVRHGSGQYLSSCGTILYDGQWAHGDRHGQGTMSWYVLASSPENPSLDRREEGDGESLSLYVLRCRYIGDWENGVQSGWGLLESFEGLDTSSLTASSAANSSDIARTTSTSTEDPHFIASAPPGLREILAANSSSSAASVESLENLETLHRGAGNLLHMHRRRRYYGTGSGSGSGVRYAHVYTYEGEWQGGERHGQGRWTKKVLRQAAEGMQGGSSHRVAVPRSLETTSSYTGEWQHGRRNGIGVQVWWNPTLSWIRPGHNVYCGEWQDDERHGFGLFEYATGSLYRGMFHRNMKHTPAPPEREMESEGEREREEERAEADAGVAEKEGERSPEGEPEEDGEGEAEEFGEPCASQAVFVHENGNFFVAHWENDRPLGNAVLDSQQTGHNVAVLASTTVNPTANLSATATSANINATNANLAATAAGGISTGHTGPALGAPVIECLRTVVGDDVSGVYNALAQMHPVLRLVYETYCRQNTCSNFDTSPGDGNAQELCTADGVQAFSLSWRALFSLFRDTSLLGPQTYGALDVPSLIETVLACRWWANIPFPHMCTCGCGGTCSPALNTTELCEKNTLIPMFSNTPSFESVTRDAQKLEGLRILYREFVELLVRVSAAIHVSVCSSIASQKKRSERQFIPVFLDVVDRCRTAAMQRSRGFRRGAAKGGKSSVGVPKLALSGNVEIFRRPTVVHILAKYAGVIEKLFRESSATDGASTTPLPTWKSVLSTMYKRGLDDATINSGITRWLYYFGRKNGQLVQMAELGKPDDFSTKLSEKQRSNAAAGTKKDMQRVQATGASEKRSISLSYELQRSAVLWEIGEMCVCMALARAHGNDDEVAEALNSIFAELKSSQ